MSPRVKIVSRSDSDGGRVEPSPPGVEPVAAIATTATSPSTTSAGRTTPRGALPRMSLSVVRAYATPGSFIGSAL